MKNDISVARGILTTNHPSSSYGMPVYLMDGRAYGPEDIWPDKERYKWMVGTIVSTCDDVSYGRLDAKATDVLCKWLGQSAVHGLRWIGHVRRGAGAELSE